jgi:hypothetical protein
MLSYGGVTKFEVNVRTGKGDLWKEVDQLLRRRSGWILHATATPGASPVWCHRSGRENDLTVGVDRDSIHVYLERSEREVTFGSTSAFVAWLQEHDLRPVPKRVGASVRPNSPSTPSPHRAPSAHGTDVRARPDNDPLWKHVDELLRHRPGWSLQAIATPGVPPAWSFGSDLIVEVRGGSICVYLVNSEREVAFGTTSDLGRWLVDHVPESMRDSQGSSAQRLKSVRFLRWQ